MVSLAALVLTITMVVVQLAMGQFSPRIVQRILRDKPSQLAIGLFVATFVLPHVPGEGVSWPWWFAVYVVAFVVLFVSQRLLGARLHG